jgi:hypothetical protein
MKSKRTILTIVGVLAIICVLLFLYFTNKTSILANNTTDTQTTQPTTQLPNTQPDPKQPVEDPNYLVIKEWGVRFKLPVELQGDVYYVINTDGSAKFGSYTLEKIESECSADETGVGPILIRTKQGDTVPDYYSKSFKSIGLFDYRLVGKGTGCNQSGRLDENSIYVIAESSIGVSILSSLENL